MVPTFLLPLRPLGVDHETLCILRLVVGQLIDGVAGVVGRLGGVQSQHGAGVVGKWLKLHSLYNLDRNGELFNELCSHADYKPPATGSVVPLIIINNVIKQLK